MVGLMNVLAEEGRKNNIRVNTISPTAATRMTEELLPPQALALMRPEAITPAVEFLLSEDAPTRTIMGAGAGSFAVIKIIETEGINLAQSDWTPDAIAAHFAEIDDVSKAKALQGAFEQTQKYVGAGRGAGRDQAVAHGAPRRSWRKARFAPCHPRLASVAVDEIVDAHASLCPPMTTVLMAARRTLPPCLHLAKHVAVIGAGPAGLMAAEVLAQGGASVTVYDAMPSAGRKFLMAGRGGLNLTHSEPLPHSLRATARRCRI